MPWISTYLKLVFRDSDTTFSHGSLKRCVTWALLSWAEHLHAWQCLWDPRCNCDNWIMPSSKFQKYPGRKEWHPTENHQFSILSQFRLLATAWDTTAEGSYFFSSVSLYHLKHTCPYSQLFPCPVCPSSTPVFFIFVQINICMWKSFSNRHILTFLKQEIQVLLLAKLMWS